MKRKDSTYFDFKATSFRNIQGQRQLLKNNVFSSKHVMAFFWQVWCFWSMKSLSVIVIVMLAVRSNLNFTWNSTLFCSEHPHFYLYMFWYSMFLLCTAQMYSQAPFPILYPSFFSLVCVLYVLYSTMYRAAPTVHKYTSSYVHFN